MGLKDTIRALPIRASVESRSQDDIVNLRVNTISIGVANR